MDILFSFDTTSSMQPAIRQVRHEVEKTINHLFTEIPNLRIGLISHGDYCDGNKKITVLDLTTDQQKLCKFVKESHDTHGGDLPECYELVLNTAYSFDWSKGYMSRALIMIGDDVPHERGYRHGSTVVNINWRDEVLSLVEKGVATYGVQALGHHWATSFYEQLARLGGGYKLDLAQFGQVVDLMKAICYQRAGTLSSYAELLYAKAKESIDPSLIRNVDILLGKKKNSYNDLAVSYKSTGGLSPVHPSRFQVLSVYRDVAIKDFVLENGAAFKKGRGFYEFTKPVKVQSYKEVIIQDKDTGEMFPGENARKLLGIPVGKDAQVRPNFGKYRGFIQSTSVNRKLLEGTSFLYEIEDWTE